MATKLDEPASTAKLLTPRSLELSASVDIGFNSITKNLESLSGPFGVVNSSPKDYSMVFVARGSQSPAFNHHFPQMIAAASRNLPEKEKIRLVGFSKPCSERIGNTLGIPRVSSIAISRHAPGAEALLAVVDSLVAPVDSPWLSEVPNNEYKTTQIASVETTIGTKRVK
jgi:ribonuclease P/MRP protein subunit POP3